MKYLLIALFLASCGKKESLEVINGTNGTNGHSLVSELVELESNLLCPTGGQQLDIYLDLDDTLTVSPNDSFNTSLIVCNGINGKDGIDGVDGVDGKDGRPGRRGPRGLQGLVGASGQNGTDGRDGVDGIQGERGVQGPAGPQGIQGIQGIQGEAGMDGAPGTAVSIISYTSNSCTKISGASYYVKPNGSNIAVYSNSSCSGSSKVDELSDGHSFWFSSSSLGVVIESGGIRVINFN